MHPNILRIYIHHLYYYLSSTFTRSKHNRNNIVHVCEPCRGNLKYWPCKFNLWTSCMPRYSLSLKLLKRFGSDALILSHGINRGLWFYTGFLNECCLPFALKTQYILHRNWKLRWSNARETLTNWICKTKIRYRYWVRDRNEHNCSVAQGSKVDSPTLT